MMPRSDIIVDTGDDGLQDNGREGMNSIRYEHLPQQLLLN